MSSQPYINWNNQIKPLDRPVLPEPCETPKTLAVKVQDASRHPWGVTDYHLYLAAMERGRDVPTRLNGVMVVENDGFIPYSLEDLLETDTSRHPILTFLNMPLLPLSTTAPLTEQKLVLGYDLERKHLLGYFFESAPDDLADVWYVWHERQLVIDLPIDRFLDIYRHGVESDRQCEATTSTPSPTSTTILNTGIFRHFRESKHELPTGMDLVVTIQFAQFLQDFQALWSGAKSLDTKVRILTDDEEYCRTQLCQVSLASWFGVRDGMKRASFREKKIGQRLGGLLLDHPSAVPSVGPAQANKRAAISRLIVISEQLQGDQSQIQQFLLACLFFSTLIS